ncbi:ATP-binding protein [Pantoea dispersa]|uniref:ATP-binding protein n=1 Tax=Pantoea dispersa TaxID=59814 RepID=UPI00133117DA|nr:ATP-binding protein [Pantoea dispersa]
MANPVIHYAVQQDWPIDYISQDKHFGLSRAYLDHIENVTGLRFVLATEPGEAGLVSNMAPGLMVDTEREKWIFSQRWITANALIVTRPGTTSTRTLQQLRGKRVSIRDGSDYEYWLRRHYPDITLLPQADLSAVLNSLQREEVDAAIGPDILMRPLLYRHLKKKLVVAGQIPLMVTGLHMAVSRDREPLRSIIDKTLAAMSASQTDALFSHWLGDLKIGQLTANIIFSVFPLELTLFTLLITGLIWALWRALRHRRRAVISEASMGQFLAIMSHEIRTPMNAMIAALELLRLPCNTQQREDYLALAHTSSKHLMGLLNDILDHSKLSHGQIRLDKQCFSLTHMMEDLSALQEPVAAEKGLKLVTSLDKTLEHQWIVADSYRLRQIINNLLANAIKFTEEGVVSLEVVYQPYAKKEGLRITISDTGIGIPLSAQSTLFDAWTQADNATQRRYDGSGLGLFICHELVSLAGGQIRFNSQPGKGSTFCVEIPVVFCDKPTRPAKNDAGIQRLATGSSILVVEDHPANQAILAAQLKALNCHYDMANDGREALSLLEDENYYDVILLDCNLPDMDGYEVSRRIRAFENERNQDMTPIVAISALSGSKHQQQCLESGMQAWLTKPLLLSCLSTMLSRWCESDNTGQSVNEITDIKCDITAYLSEDIKGFDKALREQNIRWMLHYMHRIHGAALSFQLQPLADCAADFEQQLRTAEIPSILEGENWIEQLRNHLSAAHA